MGFAVADRDEVHIFPEEALHGEHDELFIAVIRAHDHVAVLAGDSFIYDVPQGILKAVTDKDRVWTDRVGHKVEVQQLDLPGPVRDNSQRTPHDRGPEVRVV